MLTSSRENQVVLERALTYKNPELTKIMPWAGTHVGEGPAAVLKTFVDVNRYWTVIEFKSQQILGDGEKCCGLWQFHSEVKKVAQAVHISFFSPRYG